jgi:hypothetical protein
LAGLVRVIRRFDWGRFRLTTLVGLIYVCSRKLSPNLKTTAIVTRADTRRAAGRAVPPRLRTLACAEGAALPAPHRTEIRIFGVSNMQDEPGATTFNSASQLEELRTEIAAVAATATPEDHRVVAEIITTAKQGERNVVPYTLSAAVMAVLHSRHNPHNRDVNVVWVRELARRMKAGQWRWNNELPGFYGSGELSDAGHRLAAGAIARFRWQTAIVFGIERDAITTIDDGKKRHGHEAAKLNGIQMAALKEKILRISTAYLIKAGSQDATPLRSVTEIAGAVARESSMLEMAIEIARASATNVVNPVLKETVAAVISFLMLTHHWPELRVREKLALFNQGNYSEVGENDPFFVAGETITAARKKIDSRDRLNTNKEIGVVLSVMEMTARGVRAVRKAQLLAGLKKGLPEPTYPGEPEPAPSPPPQPPRSPPPRQQRDEQRDAPPA